MPFFKGKPSFLLSPIFKEILNFDWPVPVYLVGGGVRNLLLKKEVCELDLLVPSLSEALVRKLAKKLCSPFFRLGKKDYVYRLLTTEGKIDLIPLFRKDLFKEVERRDFTINSLLLPLSAFEKEVLLETEVIDFLGGLEDLKKGVLRLCRPDAFRKDPIRLLRALRLSLELNFEIEENTASRLQKEKKWLKKAPVERVKAEILKLFSLEFPDQVWEKLLKSSLLKEMLSWLGLKFKPKEGASLIKKSLKVMRKVDHFFSGYFEKELEKEVKVRPVWLFFLALFLSSGEKTKIPSALKKLRFSRKAVKTSLLWLKSFQKDWLKNREEQAELVVETGPSFPGCLALILTLRNKPLSQKEAFLLKKMFEVEKENLYPFSGREVKEETGIEPSPALGKEMRRRKIAFLAGISPVSQK